MQVMSIQNRVENNIVPQFKSVYPVVHWLAETNSSYAPVQTEKLSRILNGKFVRLLNIRTGELSGKIKEVQSKITEMTTQINSTQDVKLKHKLEKQLTKLMQENKSLNFIQKIRQYIAKKDTDYAEIPYVRTFYNKKGGYTGDKFEPLVYLLTGRDALHVENVFGKPIGQVQGTLGLNNSAELQMVKNNYWKQGLPYVKVRAKEYANKNNNSIPVGLHIKMNTIRTNTGKINGYDVVGMGFYPLAGEESPFVKTGFIKTGNQ